MRKIRVLVVDDSTVIRRLLTETLNADPAIEVAGTAANGKIALAKLPQLAPDVVTLDMEMPEMDGIATLVELRKLYPRLPVIMFSTLTSRGAQATFDALAKGASDYVAKPANVGSVTASIQNVRAELLPKIKGLCDWFTAGSERTVQAAKGPRPMSSSGTGPLSATRAPVRVDVVAIGCSTGGPNALQAVLSALPADFPVPVVVTQHMPPIFTKHLATRLNQLCPLQVEEATDGMPLAAGQVLIAPGDRHLTLINTGSAVFTGLSSEPPENSCRPAVDVMFRSVAGVFGPHSLGVVLTGMGQDGRQGSLVISSAGGQVLAQDQATSVVWGMPRAVVESGAAQAVLPLEGMAGEIERRVRALRSAPRILRAGAITP